VSEDDDAVRALLAYLGAAMVATGQPVSDVEDELAGVSAALGYPDVQIAASPTGVMLNLASGAAATFESVKGGLRLDQAAEVRAIRHRLSLSTLTVSQATEELLELRHRPPRYPQWLANLGWIAIATGIALILQPGGANVAFAAVGAVVVVALFRLGQRFGLIATLLPTLAAFLLACGVFAATNADLLDGPLRTLLPPLAVLLPGALIVTAMSELAAGDMVAGASRLIFGLVQLLLFTLGIVAASHVITVPAAELANLRVDTLGWWAAPLGLILISIGIGVLESPPVRLLPWITVVLILAFAAQSFGQHVGGAVLGSFLGAVASSRPCVRTCRGWWSSCRHSGCSSPAASVCSPLLPSSPIPAVAGRTHSGWRRWSVRSRSGCWSARPSLGPSAVPSTGCGAGIRCADAVGRAAAFCAERPHPWSRYRYAGVR
jgi:uncharacterized membrane protein YjjP (DUF1212 family)